MFDIFLVSSIILAWFTVLSIVWQIVAFTYFVSKKIEVHKSNSAFIMPAIVLSPLILVVAFQSFGVYLIFPISLLTDFMSQIRSGFIPGLVVFLASGMAHSIYQNTRLAIYEWRNKPFCLMAEAYGSSKRATIRSIVCSSSYLDSLNRCLPWVFGELFIVECIFNAPGLSYETWKSAKMEDFESLVNCVAVITLIYLIIWFAQNLYSSIIKRRLSNYV